MFDENKNRKRKIDILIVLFILVYILFIDYPQFHFKKITNRIRAFLPTNFILACGRYPDKAGLEWP
jgi:hypothetical protein